MALLKTVVRKYTPPTCTLEVRGQESLLSRWAGRTILQDLKFKLSFDDPRQPDDKQISIWGDRSGLEALSSAVSEYIHKFLQSRDGELEINGKEPIVDSLPRPKVAAATAQIEADPANAPTKILPISPIFQNQTLNPYLKPKGLVTHELFLGALQTPESGTSIDLSALQLFDLATALDAYGAEMLNLPASSKSSPTIPLWAYGAGAAAAIAAAVGLAPTAMKLANTSNSTGTVVSQSTETPAVTALNPNTDAAIAPTNPVNPTAPVPLGSPSPGVVGSTGQGNLPFGAAPPNVTSTPGAIPGNIPSNIPNLPNGLGSATPPGVSSTISPPPSTVIPRNTAPVNPGTNAPNPQFGGRSSQYGFPSGVALNPLGNRNPSSKNPRVASSGKSKVPQRTLTTIDPTNPRPPKNTSTARNQKKSRTSVPTLGSGQVQPYIDPGDNPGNLVAIDDSGSVNSIVASEASETAPKNSRSNRSRRSGNNAQKPQVFRSQPSKDLEIASSAPALPKFNPQDFDSSSPIESTGEPEPEASTAVTPQFVPNASPPPLGEIPSLSDSPKPEVALSRQSGNTSVANTPDSSSSSSLKPTPGASDLVSSSNIPNPITAGSINNDLAAVRNLDSIQASEVKRYFEGQWKGIKEVKQSLDYTLAIDSSGSISRIIPITEISRQYIDRTGMPKLTNTPMVSPLTGSQGVKIRVSLEPDGTVKTFQEP